MARRLLIHASSTHYTLGWLILRRRAAGETAHRYIDRSKYAALMEIVQNRLTTRAFDASYAMPREH
jgi:hypothetical protein